MPHWLGWKTHRCLEMQKVGCLLFAFFSTFFAWRAGPETRVEAVPKAGGEKV